MCQSTDKANIKISTAIWECDNPNCWCKNSDNPTTKSLSLYGSEKEDDYYGVDKKLLTPGKDVAKTYDEGKEPLAWLPWAAITELAKVQQYGHTKYKDFNNYKKGLEVSRNLSCALRHIRDYLSGVDVDAESGLHPLSHALCRIAFILQNIHDRVEIDDRYKK